MDRLLTLEKFLGAGDVASDAALLCATVVISVLSVCLTALHFIIASIRAPKIVVPPRIRLNSIRIFCIISSQNNLLCCLLCT